jgi:hypothetical protein
VFTITGSDGLHDYTAREQRDGSFRVTAGTATVAGGAVEKEDRLQVPPMPVSTLGEVEKVRPERKPIEVDEKIGPFAREGTKIWVGKTFYDGEGSSGIGDIGYYDSVSQAWSFLHVPEMTGWSASAILVEATDIWVGLLNRDEGAGIPGGLLRYDRRTHAVKKYALPDVVLKIVRVGRAVYCGTSGGFAVVGGDGVKRFAFVPQLDDSYVVAAAPTF